MKQNTPKVIFCVQEKIPVTHKKLTFFPLLTNFFPQGFPFRKCQPQDVVIQPEAEAALKVREAQPKEPERAGAGSPLPGTALENQARAYRACVPDTTSSRKPART